MQANALSEVLARLGISSDKLMAFGDAENDIAMLQLAGYGIAMRNATSAVKAAADEVTFSNNANGVAVAIYKHFPDFFLQ